MSVPPTMIGLQLNKKGCCIVNLLNNTQTLRTRTKIPQLHLELKNAENQILQMEKLVHKNSIMKC